MPAHPQDTTSSKATTLDIKQRPRKTKICLSKGLNTAVSPRQASARSFISHCGLKPFSTATVAGCKFDISPRRRPTPPAVGNGYRSLLLPVPGMPLGARPVPEPSQPQGQARTPTSNTFQPRGQGHSSRLLSVSPAANLPAFSALIDHSLVFPLLAPVLITVRPAAEAST